MSGILLFGMMSLATAQFSNPLDGGFSGSTTWQSAQPSFNQFYSTSQAQEYWPILSRMESDQCDATSDFIIGIPPGGCSPGVVRSDLLAEQNVPVFCQLYAVKVNPLIKVSSIKSISFKGDYPEGVAGISFHPARAAVKSYRTLLGDPVINNIGYVVIVLERNKVEKDMAEWISGNLSATIRYDAEEAYGTGRSQYYLPVLSDDEWDSKYQQSSFWRGKGYLRVSRINDGSATISVMTSRDHVLQTVTLKSGETSGRIYLPGYYCRAGLRVKLNGIVAPENSVLINIDGNEEWVRRGTKILNGRCTISSLNSSSDGSGEVRINCPGKTIKLNLSKKENGTGLVDSNKLDIGFGNSNDSLTDLIENYPSEKKSGSGDSYGEEALYEQILLSGEPGVEKFKTQAGLMDLFMETYPSSSLYSDISLKRQRLTNYSYEFASQKVYVTSSYHSIGIVKFKHVSEGERKVTLRIESRYETRSQGDNISIGSEGEAYTIERIVPGKVKVSYVSSKSLSSRKSVTISEGKEATLGGRTVSIENIEIEEIAYVSLAPEVQNTKTEAPFTFKVGIEKRGIELSPEKTEEMLKNINDSIEKWEKINDRLGNVVSGLKGACFATSTFLMITNAVSGFGGKSLARQKIMANYRVKCDKENGGDVSLRSACYNRYEDSIAKDVESMTTGLNEINKIMDEVIENQERSSSGLLSENSIINQEDYIKNLRAKVEVEIIDGQTINPEDMTTVSQIRAVMLYQNLKGAGGSAEAAAKADMESALRNKVLEKKAGKDANTLSKALGVDASKVVMVTPKNIQTFEWKGEIGSKYSISESNRRVQIVGDGANAYLLVLHNNTVGSLQGVEKVYRSVSGSWVEDPNNNAFGKTLFITGGPSGECSNKWPDSSAKVSYYTGDKNTRLPAIVPFDLDNGWYVKVPSSGGTLLESQPKGYQASGEPNYFYICNIGANRIMESAAGDDICQSFSSNTAAKIESFRGCPTMSSGKVQRLYEDGKKAIRQASAQYGSKNIRILDKIMGLGAPAADLAGFECQDFMSPADCNIMFNVCDPVICPASRCDMGGKMPVSDVIQTGIIGSIALCLPNAREGILMPVCLSGIHAGVDTFVSVLKSEQDCLRTSLETGEYVGICDEITAINKCEFFWRQASPVIDIIIPKAINGLYGGFSGTRGGGEYLLVQNAWDNMQKSVSFFKDTYAQNAFKAFNLRSVEEAGSTFCRSFVGTSFPTSANALESLLEPESPSQFYARFSERLFTDATLPATSQYKVYYHIYAGKEKSVQYRVYLKNPPASAYYRTNPTFTVKSGHIALGTSADESIDFTAPAGYKELCVVLDGKEECGFKQVTSSVGLDWVKNKYVEEQATETGITSERTCISGSPSALPLATLNLQSGAEEAVNPEIALRGIVRICATRNPNENVNSSQSVSRWKDVGYCGEENFRCWLDTDSVKKDLESVAAIENKSISLLNEQKGLIENTRLGFEQVQKKLSSSDKSIKELDGEDLKNSEKVGVIVSGLNEIIGLGDDEVGAGTNADRAFALSLKTSLYRKIVSYLSLGTLDKPEPVARPVVEEEEEKFVGVSAIEEEELVEGKVTWKELIDGKYVLENTAVNQNYSLFTGKTLRMYEFNFENQTIIVDNVGRKTYSISRNGDKIIFRDVTELLTGGVPK